MRDTQITSVLSHHEEKANYPKQEQQVLTILSESKAPLTARAIRAEMARRWRFIELSSAHRAINTLKRERQLYRAKIDKCPFTRKRVSFYALAQKKEGEQ